MLNFVFFFGFVWFKARKQRTIQVMDIHEIPKPKNAFFARNKGGFQAKHWWIELKLNTLIFSDPKMDFETFFFFAWNIFFGLYLIVIILLLLSGHYFVGNFWSTVIGETWTNGDSPCFIVLMILWRATNFTWIFKICWRLDLLALNSNEINELIKD